MCTVLDRVNRQLITAPRAERSDLQQKQQFMDKVISEHVVLMSMHTPTLDPLSRTASDISPEMTPIDSITRRLERGQRLSEISPPSGANPTVACLPLCESLNMCCVCHSLSILEWRIPLLDQASVHSHNHTLTHSHTMLVTCTCCYDLTKGTQDKDFSYSFSDSLFQFSLSITYLQDPFSC